MEPEIINDITGNTQANVSPEMYAELFKSRYDKVGEKIGNGMKFKNIKRNEGENSILVGLVKEKRLTKDRDAWIVTLEDPTGEVVVYVGKDRKPVLSREVERVVIDEVVGFKAKIPPDLDKRGSPLVWGNKMMRPGIPQPSGLEDISKSDEAPLAVLMSDLHIGSKKFKEESFEDFIDWVSEESRIANVLIAGDLVDGVGVYPDQNEELEIDNVTEQYEKLAGYLSEIPDSVDIILGPGNHDAVRLAEPQPAIQGEIAELLISDNIHLVGSPCYMKLGNLRFLMYHGEGFDDLASEAGISYSNPKQMAVETLKRGHLAPVYRTSENDQAHTAPEPEDHLVVPDVVDVFHTGHIHKFSTAMKKGVSMVVSSTFQDQTSYQKEKGIEPDVSQVATINLKTGHISGVKGFQEEKNGIF